MIVFVCRLRKEYRTFNEKLGQTGAGLRFEDIKEGSDLQNLVGACITPCVAATPQLTLLRSTSGGFPILEAPPWVLAHVA
jgi:hypothetical protein